MKHWVSQTCPMTREMVANGKIGLPMQEQYLSFT